MMAEEENKQPPQSDSQPPANNSGGGDGDDSLDENAPTGNNNQPATPDATPAAPGPELEPEPVESSKERLRSSFNIYFILYIIIVGIAIGIIVFAVSASKKNAKTSVKTAASLTSQQIASLKGNTTVVGDSKQTLDVQSNSVFEGQVLVRSDLSVAGDIKVGGALSLPALTVGGEGTFGSLQVGKDLGVNGNGTVQGSFTVQQNLAVGGSASFNSLSVGALSATSLKFTGDLTVSHHIVTNGTSVKMSPGSAVGGGGTVSASGTDTAGTVTINTGNSPPPGIFVTVTFANSFASVPRVIISPVGVSAGSVTYYVNRTPNGFSIGCTTAPPAGASFSFDYFVIN